MMLFTQMKQCSWLAMCIVFASCGGGGGGGSTSTTNTSTDTLSGTSSDTTSNVASSPSVDATAMLKAHNDARATYSNQGVQPLTYSTTLAASSQVWADNLKNNNGCNMKHSTGGNVGENLYWASPITYTSTSNGSTTTTTAQQNIQPINVVKAWMDEVVDYTYSTNTCASGKQCGHYTQVIWKSTTEVGCAMAVCGDKSQVWVCQYAPPGNYVGQKPY